MMNVKESCKNKYLKAYRKYMQMNSSNSKLSEIQFRCGIVLGMESMLVETEMLTFDEIKELQNQVKVTTPSK